VSSFVTSLFCIFAIIRKLCFFLFVPVQDQDIIFIISFVIEFFDRLFFVLQIHERLHGLHCFLHHLFGGGFDTHFFNSGIDSHLFFQRRFHFFFLRQNPTP